MLKRLIKSCLPGGARPRRILRGPARGIVQELDLRKDTQVWLGRYERDVMVWTLRHVPRDGVCVDIGAASGLFALLLARKAGPQGKVVAFEPDANKLRQAILLNRHAPLAPIEVVEGFAGTGRTSETISVDQKVAELGISRVDFLKIDVDGAEADVLQGLNTILQRDRPPIALELHSEPLRDQCVSVLDRLGYDTRIESPPAYEYRPIDYNTHLYALCRR